MSGRYDWVSLHFPLFRFRNPYARVLTVYLSRRDIVRSPSWHLLYWTKTKTYQRHQSPHNTNSSTAALATNAVSSSLQDTGRHHYLQVKTLKTGTPAYTSLT